MKENELQYVKKEVQCLREELQMMQKVGVFWELPEKELPVGELPIGRGKGRKQQGLAGFDGMLKANPLVACAACPC